MQRVVGALLPDYSNPCTADACDNGVPSYTPLAVGTACGAGMECDGAGHCVGGLHDGCLDCNVQPCGVGLCKGLPIPGATCSDGNPCTSDFCDSSGDGTSCGSGMTCTAGTRQ